MKTIRLRAWLIVIACQIAFTQSTHASPRPAGHVLFRHENDYLLLVRHSADKATQLNRFAPNYGKHMPLPPAAQSLLSLSEHDTVYQVSLDRAENLRQLANFQSIQIDEIDIRQQASGSTRAAKSKLPTTSERSPRGITPLIDQNMIVYPSGSLDAQQRQHFDQLVRQYAAVRVDGAQGTGYRIPAGELSIRQFVLDARNNPGGQPVHLDFDLALLTGDIVQGRISATEHIDDDDITMQRLADATIAAVQGAIGGPQRQSDVESLLTQLLRSQGGSLTSSQNVADDNTQLSFEVPNENLATARQLLDLVSPQGQINADMLQRLAQSTNPFEVMPPTQRKIPLEDMARLVVSRMNEWRDGEPNRSGLPLGSLAYVDRNATGMADLLTILGLDQSNIHTDTLFQRLIDEVKKYGPDHLAPQGQGQIINVRADADAVGRIASFLTLAKRSGFSPIGVGVIEHQTDGIPRPFVRMIGDGDLRLLDSAANRYDHSKLEHGLLFYQMALVGPFSETEVPDVPHPDLLREWSNLTHHRMGDLANQSTPLESDDPTFMVDVIARGLAQICSIVGTPNVSPELLFEAVFEALFARYSRPTTDNAEVLFVTDEFGLAPRTVLELAITLEAARRSNVDVLDVSSLVTDTELSFPNVPSLPRGHHWSVFIRSNAPENMTKLGAEIPALSHADLNEQFVAYAQGIQSREDVATNDVASHTATDVSVTQDDTAQKSDTKGGSKKNQGGSGNRNRKKAVVQTTFIQAARADAIEQAFAAIPRRLTARTPQDLVDQIEAAHRAAKDFIDSFGDRIDGFGGRIEVQGRSGSAARFHPKLMLSLARSAARRYGDLVDSEPFAKLKKLAALIAEAEKAIQPTVKGQRNWKPEELDDLWLEFEIVKEALGKLLAAQADGESPVSPQPVEDSEAVAAEGTANEAAGTTGQAMDRAARSMSSKDLLRYLLSTLRRSVRESESLFGDVAAASEIRQSSPRQSHSTSSKTESKKKKNRRIRMVKYDDIRNAANRLVATLKKVGLEPKLAEAVALIVIMRDDIQALIENPPGSLAYNLPANLRPEFSMLAGTFLLPHFSENEPVNTDDRLKTAYELLVVAVEDLLNGRVDEVSRQAINQFRLGALQHPVVTPELANALNDGTRKQGMTLKITGYQPPQHSDEGKADGERAPGADKQPDAHISDDDPVASAVVEPRIYVEARLHDPDGSRRPRETIALGDLVSDQATMTLSDEWVNLLVETIRDARGEFLVDLIPQAGDSAQAVRAAAEVAISRLQRELGERFVVEYAHQGQQWHITATPPLRFVIGDAGWKRPWAYAPGRDLFTENVIDTNLVAEVVRIVRQSRGRQPVIIERLSDDDHFEEDGGNEADIFNAFVAAIRDQLGNDAWVTTGHVNGTQMWEIGFVPTPNLSSRDR